VHMQIDIPGHEQPLVLDKVIFDLNGTLTTDGKLIDGVEGRMKELRDRCSDLFLFTGDTHGNGAAIAERLGLELRKTTGTQQKADEARKLGASTCAAIGNGRIDVELFKIVRLRIATIQAEGLHPMAAENSDIIVPSINDAIDLLLKEKRLIASLRK